MEVIKGRKAQRDHTRQRIYDYIVGYIIANGFPPSVREIGAGVGIASTGVVYGHLHKMHETGMIMSRLICFIAGFLLARQLYKY